MSEITKRVITIQRAFRCRGCGRVDVYEMTATPIHCGRPMDAERELFRGGDPLQVRLDIIELRTEKSDVTFLDSSDPWKSSHFSVPAHWAPAYELWALRPGREQGERIGWFGFGLVGWEYEMVPGIRDDIRRGMVVIEDASDLIALGGRPVPLAIVDRMWSAVNEA